MAERETVFDHLPTSEELIAAYEAQAAADPTSPSYVRRLDRPPLHLWRVLLSFCGGVAILLGFCLYVAPRLSLARPYAVAIATGALLLLALLRAKKLLIFSVRVYQRLAPAKLRRRCRYEPSCSTYMIRSLEKYGALRGLVRGLRRWGRCKPPYGGFDEP